MPTTLPIPPALARCAEHPEVPAILTCPYCGSFACPECALTTSWGEALCTACSRAGRAISPMVRDEGRGALEAAWRALTSPRKFFGGFSRDPRPFGRPLLLAAFAGVSWFVTIAIAISSQQSMTPTAGPTPDLIVALVMALLGPVLGLGLGVNSAICVAILSKLARGALPFSSALRAGLYMSSPWLFATPLLLVVSLSARLHHSHLGTNVLTITVFGAAFALPLVHQLFSLRWLARGSGMSALAATASALAATAGGVLLAAAVYAVVFISAALVLFLAEAIQAQ